MADNVTSLFRTGAHSPSMAALARESGESGPLDFCIPCNPYFPTPAMFDELTHRLREIITFYPSSADTITGELCNLLQLPPQCVAMGNGSTELITWIDHLLVRESLAIPVPTFGRWTDQPMETGKRVDMFPLQESNGFALDPAQYIQFIRSRGSRVAVICNPNNPDGGFLPRQTILAFCDALADLDLIIIDESFLEFADAEAEPSVVEDAVMRPNVVVLRSLGKNFGLHGIRFGYLVANPSLAGKIRSMLPKWNLNSFAETVVFMLRDHGAEYLESLHQVRRDRLDMARQLSQLPGLTVYPSQGNFLFVRLPVGAEGTVVRDQLLTEHRILVRECGNKIGSSSRFLRLVVRPQVDVRRLVSGLESVLYGSRRGAAVPEPNNNYSSGTAAVDRLVSSTNGSGMQGLAAAAQGQGQDQRQQQPQLAPVAQWPQQQQQQQPQLAPVAQERQQQGLLTAVGAMGQGQGQRQGQGQGQGFGQQGQQPQQQPMTAMAQAQQQAGLSPVGAGQPQQQPGLSPVAANGQPQQEPWLTPVGQPQPQQQQPGLTPVAQPGPQPMPQPTRWPAAAASRGTPWPEAPANNRVG
ncbi:pyridoxal phosphate-dependent aminotransferase [Streptomyces yerevanensis]|uniref:pyridoxal phosphate-dependent aminotransferase n=1 Tax=Streptomyces yerevanensis TaxID=66378 RepID=UPI00099802B9|nr:histidinol-phosphate transaminase [Streptomyces yerevanensis]